MKKLSIMTEEDVNNIYFDGIKLRNDQTNSMDETCLPSICIQGNHRVEGLHLVQFSFRCSNNCEEI